MFFKAFNFFLIKISLFYAYIHNLKVNHPYFKESAEYCQFQAG